MFNKLFAALLMATLFCILPDAYAGSGGQTGEAFIKTIYVKYGGATANSGSSYDAAKPCSGDLDLWDIPAGTMITKVYVKIDTAITGSTALDFGDDDDPNGYFDGGTSGAEGASLIAGVYGWDVKGAGGYLRVETAGVSDAADIYVVPNAKYYAAAGKELKQDITTACTAGRYRVIVEGYRFQPAP